MGVCSSTCCPSFLSHHRSSTRSSATFGEQARLLSGDTNASSTYDPLTMDLPAVSRTESKEEQLRAQLDAKLRQILRRTEETLVNVQQTVTGGGDRAFLLRDDVSTHATGETVLQQENGVISGEIRCDPWNLLLHDMAWVQEPVKPLSPDSDDLLLITSVTEALDKAVENVTVQDVGELVVTLTFSFPDDSDYEDV